MLTRNLRSALIDVQTTAYVDFARAKGLDRRTVLFRHVLRAALLPIVTLIGVRLSYTIGGSVVVETVFALPGLGSWMIESIFARDYMVVQTLTLAFALGVMLINLATDLIYPLFDPRVRMGWMSTLAGATSRSRRRPGRRLHPGLAVGGAMLLTPGGRRRWSGRRMSPYDPNAHDFEQILQAPSLAHPFGTDNFGRDVLTRVLSGAAIELRIGVLAAVFPFLFGSLLGARGGLLRAAGSTPWSCGPWTWSPPCPFLVLVTAIVAFLGPGEVNIFVAIGAAEWVAYARLVRGEVLRERNLDYVAAGRALGFPRWRILLGHILPNALPPAVIFLTSDVVLVILTTAALGFLGLGVRPPGARVGDDDVRGAGVPQQRLVGGDHAGLRLPVHGSGLHPARRRRRRPAPRQGPVSNVAQPKGVAGHRPEPLRAGRPVRASPSPRVPVARRRSAADAR